MAVLQALSLLAVAPMVADAERLPIRFYTTGDGLAHNDVYRIVRDSRGFLWFCTFEGLSRFDGYSFTTYGTEHGLPSPVVNDLLETREGQYWVATDAGLCRFNPKGIAQPRTQGGAQESAANLMFTVFPADKAGSRRVLKLLETSAGAILCGTTRGLYRVEQQNGQVTFHLVRVGMPTAPEDNIWVASIIEDRRGALWVGSGLGVFRLLADGRVEHYRQGQRGLPDAPILSLLEDREGRIWVGTQTGGLCLLVSDPDPARTVVARLYTEKDGLPNKWINQLLQASDGSLWAGSSGGLIQFIPTADGRDFRFRAYARAHGLSNEGIGPLAEDRNGNLWVGTEHGGAAKIARSGITTFGEADGLTFPRSIFKNQAGDFLVFETGGPASTTYYISRFDAGRFARIQLRVPAVYQSWGWNQLVLEDRAGEWWVATGKGIYRFPRVDSFDQLARMPPKAFYTTRDGLAGNMILRLFEDSRGDIWISAVDPRCGLARWERATETFHHYTEKVGLPLFTDSYVTSFCEDHAGDVWIGFNYNPSLGVSGGLVRYRDGRFTSFTSANGIPEGGIFNLFIDSSGRLWIPTTRGGVCRTDSPQAERPTFSTYTTADGLASNSVKCLTEDRQGRIYIGSARSIDRLDLATGYIRHYTTADGLPVGDPHAALRDGEGALWFTFSTGLVRLIAEPPSPPLPPPILITGLTIAGGARPISALGEYEIAPVELGAGENQLQIDFVALGLSPGEGLRYQYRLEGASENWSPLTEQRTVNFANLAPGSYRFLVCAVNADGVMSESPASFSFAILPPIWQRWWFIGLVVALLGLLVYSMFLYRLARLVELERMRTRIAADLHDDIGANLTKITILSEVAHQQMAVDSRRVNNALSSIADISRESAASMRDIVWAINPKRDKLLDLTRRMRGFASDIFTSRDIAFQFRARDRDRELKLSPEVRRDVFLIFKEAVNNIVRHSGCARADIEVRVEDGWLAVDVNDYGTGFDLTEAGEGQGLSGMRRRAEGFGGRLEISSREGGGTTVRLKVPVTRRHIHEGARGREKRDGNVHRA
jgi:ligand-binding sensor domain-containing protein/two-component sensor histidine kinase